MAFGCSLLEKRLRWIWLGTVRARSVFAWRGFVKKNKWEVFKWHVYDTAWNDDSAGWNIGSLVKCLVGFIFMFSCWHLFLLFRWLIPYNCLCIRLFSCTVILSGSLSSYHVLVVLLINYIWKNAIASKVTFQHLRTFVTERENIHFDAARQKTIKQFSCLLSWWNWRSWQKGHSW